MTSNPNLSSDPVGSTPTASSGPSVPRSVHEPMFDIAEEIKRLCKEGSSPTLPNAAAQCPESQLDVAIEPSASEAAPSCEPPRTESLADSVAPDALKDSTDFLSPQCVTKIAESVARCIGHRTAILVLSPSGSVIESSQFGWRPSDFRTHLSGLQSVARECIWGKTGTFYNKHVAAPELLERSQGLQFRPSTLLAQWAEQIDEPGAAAYSFSLPESRGHAVVLCSVPTETAFASFSHTVNNSLEAIASQLDTWLVVRRSRGLSHWIGIVDWIRTNPRWCLIPLFVAIAAMFLPVPYYPKRQCVIEPEARQFVASPIQGRVASCLVQPGDTVHAGQLLATIDDDQLQRDLATAQAQLESAKQKSNAALSNKTSGNYSIAMLEFEKASLEIESIQQQLERLEIRSPVPGVVLYGDLQKSIGMPVTLGQNLFEVAELQSMTAEIHLTASDLEQIHVGSKVNVRSDATGFRGFQGQIQRIEPRATVIQNQAIFIADVAISDSQDQLRPGMKASARVDAGWRSLGWLMFHRPLQWLSQQWIW